MTTVYLLWHEYEEDDDDGDEKLIGVYSTEEKAKQAAEALKDQPGFKDWPQGFNVYSCTLDETSWVEGFVTILPGEE